MTGTPTSASSEAQQWAWLAAELDIDATVAGPPVGACEKSRLDIINAELLLPSGEDEAIVIVRVKTKAGRVLEFDMALPWDAIVDATVDYDDVDGELVEHDYGLGKAEEVARYFEGQRF